MIDRLLPATTDFSSSLFCFPNIVTVHWLQKKHADSRDSGLLSCLPLYVPVMNGGKDISPDGQRTDARKRRL